MVEEAPIKTTVEELRKLIHISNYIGEPIESEDKILIPVSKAAVGFGIGEQKAGQEITATGAGVSVEPVTMVVVSKGNSGADGIRTINLSKGNSTNKTLNELGLILTDVLKDVIPSKRKDDDYINANDVTEVEIQDGEIKEKAEDIII
ncbi:GerW family sporulation protein [uncultured Methanobrevibacter sp.]|uniref:GerW family sporulation protein n=1 Tax=uncultured Methanobrevibacter sp. TaxID=253161 RepID=UPI0025F50E96|nr:spore germination protein GerW family protein [uncultured Methanobrevibacter sp.]